MAHPPARRRKLAWLAMVLLALAGGVVSVLWALQRQLIYFPDSSPVPAAGDVLDGARDVTLETTDGLTLDAWFVPAGGRDTGIAVLMAPGNGGNRLGRAGLAEQLSQRGLAALVMDYRGYGGNPGDPSEQGLARDADAATEALQRLGYDSDHTIYLGESLGTGVVAALQSRRPPAGVVLRSPFTELADVAAEHYPFLPARTLLQDRFPVLAHVRGSAVPLVVVYGDQDEVVPTRLSEQVAVEAGSLLDRVVIAGAGHNDPVMFGEVVADAVEGLALKVGGNS